MVMDVDFLIDLTTGRPIVIFGTNVRPSRQHAIWKLRRLDPAISSSSRTKFESIDGAILYMVILRSFSSSRTVSPLVAPRRLRPRRCAGAVLRFGRSVLFAAGVSRRFDSSPLAGPSPVDVLDDVVEFEPHLSPCQPPSGSTRYYWCLRSCSCSFAPLRLSRSFPRSS